MHLAMCMHMHGYMYICMYATINNCEFTFVIICSCRMAIKNVEYIKKGSDADETDGAIIFNEFDGPAVVDGAITDVNKVNGILSGALGGLPFKVGFFIVVLYQLLYISYKAFLETGTHHVIQDDCYCAHRDQIIYRTMTFTLMGAWILFLPTYGFYKTVNHFTCTERICCKDKSHKDRRKIKNLYEDCNEKIEQCREYFLKELNDMITTYYLDSEHYDSKQKKLEDAGAITYRVDNLKQETNEGKEKEKKGSKDENDAKGIKQWCATKNCCFMLLQIILISMRFGFHLVIIPLFQLHWLNDYAWNCIFNNLLRDYCATIKNEYFIGLDHSLVLYFMYVFILSAILFNIIIDWFPRGIPNFILKFEGNFNSLKIDVTSGKKQNDIQSN